MYSTIVCLILFMSATLLDVCVLLSFASLYTYRLNYLTDTSLLAALDRNRIEILLEPMHPMVEGSPVILQDHHILKERNSDQEKALIYRPIKRPQIGVHWNL